MPKKFLIVMLSANGDCAMVTAIARQIKYNDPGNYITWAIGYKCRQVIDNNPHVDHIWEIQYAPGEDVWERVKKEAEEKKANGEFDEILYCPIFPDHRERFDGTTRSSTFRVYPKPITVPVSPVIRLYENEIENVKRFAEKHRLADYKHVVLCECAPGSIQTFLNPELMLNVANKIIEHRSDILFIISTHLKLNIQSEGIIDAAELSYRENVELSKYCTFLIGCSSGITWLLTSDWAKKLPTIQFLNKPEEKPLNFASVKYDFKYYGLTTDHILESTESDLNKMVEIIDASLNDFGKAKKVYDEELRPNVKMFRLYLMDIFRLRNIGRSFKNSYIFFKNFSQRNNMGTGFRLLFPFFLTEAIVKKVRYEFLLIFGSRK